MNPNVESALRAAAGVTGDLFNKTIPRTLDKFQNTADPLLALTSPIIWWATSTIPILADRVHGKRVRLGEPLTGGSLLKYLAIGYYSLQAPTIMGWSVDKIWYTAAKMLERGATPEDAAVVIPIAFFCLTGGLGIYNFAYRPIRWYREFTRENIQADRHDLVHQSRTRVGNDAFDTPEVARTKRQKEKESNKKTGTRNALARELSPLYPHYQSAMSAHASSSSSYDSLWDTFTLEASALPSELAPQIYRIMKERYETEKVALEERERNKKASRKNFIQRLRGEEDEYISLPQVVTMTWEEYLRSKGY